MIRNKILAFALLLVVVSPVFLFSAEKKILRIEIREAITPVTERYIKRAIHECGLKGYDVLLIELDTPGGLLESTRDIVQEILNAKMDTIVYISPKGSRAGSAGVFITLSATYAVMAPGCNIGAAHPVSMGGSGQDNSSNSAILSKKIENDTIAFMESIAKIRSRNVEWAIRSVRESSSISSEKALANGVVDYIAAERTDLLQRFYGKKTEFRVAELKKSWAENLLTVLANPNLAYFLMILGFYGILYEIIHPGTIFSGAIGAMFLIIALYAMQSLPFNFAGLFLIILAFVLFVLEVFIVSHGLLTIGGALSLVLGSALLFDPSQDVFRVHIASIITVTAMTLSVVGVLVYLAGKIIRQKASSGIEGMIGETGSAFDDFSGGKGKVKVHGEIWNAASEDTLAKDEPVTVVRVEGLSIQVKKKK